MLFHERYSIKELQAVTSGEVLIRLKRDYPKSSDKNLDILLNCPSFSDYYLRYGVLLDKER